MQTRLGPIPALLIAALVAPGAALAEAQTLAPTAPPTVTAAAPQPDFATADEAAQALAAAVRAEDAHRVAALIGPGSADWLFTGDDVADRTEWAGFLQAWDKQHAVIMHDAEQAVLSVGDEEWTFPAPIVKRGDRWAFDGDAGHDEAVVRRVGRNELDAIQTLLAIVDAQSEYAAGDLDGNGFHDYAQRFISTPGNKDGLYWKVTADEAQSPLGPLVGEAAREGYTSPAGEPQPYHGYYYRLLNQQGPAAAGGAYRYQVNDRLIGGFAVVAYPASYGVSGIMTLMVNHDGKVYEKDLGEDTPGIAAAMESFNPDDSWKPSATR